MKGIFHPSVLIQRTNVQFSENLSAIKLELSFMCKKRVSYEPCPQK